MKKLIPISFMLFALFLSGCGGSSNGNLAIIWIDNQASETNAIAKSTIQKSVTPTSVIDPDGSGTTFVSSTRMILNWSGVNDYGSKTFLELTQNGSHVDASSWEATDSSVFTTQPVNDPKVMAELQPINEGKVIITGKRGGDSTSIEVCVFKRFWFVDYDTDPGTNTVRGVIFGGPNDYTSTWTQSAADLWIVSHDENTVTVSCPYGMALVEKKTAVYFDPAIRMDLGKLKTVSDNLTYNTTATISMNESSIYIIKTAKGGYVKFLFANGFDSLYAFTFTQGYAACSNTTTFDNAF